ncbi:hypothetical protein EJB05_56429, partial [Eragrostis curvula]
MYSSYLTQAIRCICLWKQNLSDWRNVHYTGCRDFFTTIIALLFGTIFWKLGMRRTKRQDLFNSIGSMYCSVLAIGVKNAGAIQPIVAAERMVFYKERGTGMYSALPHTLAQVTIELPHNLVQALIYGVSVYAMIGFESTLTKFMWYIFFIYVTLLYFTFLGMMAVGLSPNETIAAIAVGPFYGVWNLFSGYLIPVSVNPLRS